MAKRPDPSAILADEFMASRSSDITGLTMMHDTVKPGLRAARKMVLDDDALRLAVRLATTLPAEIAQMLPIALPAEKAIFVEWSSEAMMAERERFATHPGPREPRPEWARTGALLTRANGPTAVHARCIEHIEGGTRAMVWPISYVLETGQPIPDRTNDLIARRIWGYTDTDSISMRPLLGRGMLSIHPDAKTILDGDMITALLRELSGFTRLAVAISCMINTVATIGASTRPPGTRIAGGRSHPYQPRALVTINLPRVRNQVAYVRRQIATHRKRLHEVRGHWRYLRHPPMALGWAEVSIDGTAYWRKEIAAHLRGDPDLGVVEHSGAALRGPHQVNP